MDTLGHLVTVVIPAFNGARFIDATLQSLASQTHQNIEVIVVDDGSTDDTLAVLKASGVPAKVVVQENLGVAVARNRGLALARGRWVGFVDQDDLWRADRIANLLRCAMAHDARAVASTEHPFALEIDRAALVELGDGRERWPRDWIVAGDEHLLTTAPVPAAELPEPERITIEQLMGGAAMLTTSVMYDRETALAAGGFAPHARALDDHILNLNVARIAGPILRIDTADLLYRVHPSSTTTVSPMASPFLSAMAAVRFGGVFPPARQIGPNVENLLGELADTTLSPLDQLSLLLLTVPPASRFRWLGRWGKKLLKRAIRRSSKGRG